MASVLDQAAAHLTGMNGTMAPTTLQFFQELFGDVPSDLWLYLWLLMPGSQPRDKKSVWFQVKNLKSMAKAAAAEKTSDVYFGVAVSPRAGTEHERCKVVDTVGIPGLWLDADYGEAGHQKKNLPPTAVEAIALIRKLTLDPTLIVSTGHGLQPWWLFKEPWIFTDDRQQAMDLAIRWSRLFRAKAKDDKQDQDSVGDLARVFRVPGTVNNKETPVPVSLLAWGGPRYDPADFASLVEGITLSGNSVFVEDVLVGIERQPPISKFLELMKTRRFKQSWERTRTDLQDCSASGYDLALASAAVSASWTDQEITDLLLLARREHGDDLKRPDYFQKTIAKARSQTGHIRPEQCADLEKAVEELYGTDSTDRSRQEDIRSDLIKKASGLIGLNIIRLLKIVADNPVYKLVLENGTVILGNVDAILNQRTFISRIAAHCGLILENKKPWKPVAQALLAAVEEQPIGQLGNESSQGIAWILEYLEQSSEPRSMELATLYAREPFLHQGATVFFLDSLNAYLREKKNERISQKQLASVLRSSGSSPTVVGFTRENGKKTTREVWFS